jgi:hypothetical protein
MYIISANILCSIRVYSSCVDDRGLILLTFPVIQAKRD